MSVRVQYITYDGLRDPLGQTQVIPYLLRLGELGHQIDILSFEKSPEPLGWRRPLSQHVRWTALRYHRRPTFPATLGDLAQGGAVAAALAAVVQPDLVHVRATVAGAITLPLLVTTAVPLLFDTRAFWTDERVEIGSWPKGGAIHRATGAVERRLLRRASAVTTLTNSARKYLRFENPRRKELTAPVHVIPTCVDLDRFHTSVAPDPEIRDALAGREALTYLGSLGSFYLGAEMARFYLHWRRNDDTSRLLIISPSDPEELRVVLRDAGVEHELLHLSVGAERVPGLLRCANALVSFVRPSFAKRASMPTKLGEALAVGVPVVANDIGDTAELLADSGAGVLLGGLRPKDLAQGAADLRRLTETPDHTENARRLAERWFSLSSGVRAYDEIYRGLAEPGLEVRDRAWPP